MKIIDRIFRNRLQKEEKRSDIVDVNELLRYISGNSNTYTNTVINETAALSYPSFYAAQKVISEDFASTKIKIYNNQDGIREEAKEHPLYDILHNRPNSLMTPAVFKELMMKTVLTHGYSDAYIELNGAGQVRALWVLDPYATRWEINNGDVRCITKLNGRERALFPAEVIHITGMGSNGITGYPALQYAAKQILGLGISAIETMAKLYANGMSAGGIIESDYVLGDTAKQAFMKSIIKPASGTKNAGNTLVLPKGFKYTKNAFTPVESQMLETLKYQDLCMCQILRVPPHKLGILDKATLGNVEELQIQYYSECLLIWFVKFEEEINYKLLKPPYYAEFLIDSKLRGNTASRFSAYYQATGRPWMTPNEIRKMENKPAIEGGDELLMPQNMQLPTINQVPGVPQPQNSVPNDERAELKMLEQQAITRLNRIISERLKKCENKDDVKKKEIYEYLDGKVKEELNPIYKLAGINIEPKFDITKTEMTGVI